MENQRIYIAIYNLSYRCELTLFYCIYFRSTQGMGQVANMCSGDVFKEFTDKYGETFTRFMVAEKSKDVVNDEVGKFTNQTKEVFQGFETKTNSIVDEKNNALNGIFEEMKNKVNSTVPGGIPAFEKIRGQSINEFSGFNTLQNKIVEIKKSALSRVDSQKTNTLNEIGNKKQGMIDRIDAEKPKIPVYDELPEPIQHVVKEKAEEQFKDQIEKNQGAIMEEIKKQFNINNVEAIFQKISPEGALNGILGGATSQLSSGLNLGSIGGSLGGIGNVISGGLHMFGK